MADDGRLLCKLANRLEIVPSDLPETLMGKDLWVLVGLRDGLRVIWPTGREGGIAVCSNS